MWVKACMLISSKVVIDLNKSCEFALLYKWIEIDLGRKSTRLCAHMR